MSDSTTLICSAVAPLLAEPKVSAEQVSQLLRGEKATQITQNGDWLRVCGDDLYEGWMHRGYSFLAPGAAAEPKPITFSLGATVSGSRGVAQLPFGALIFEDDKLLSGTVVELGSLAQRFAPVADAAVATAVQFFAGAPYEWGGVSPWGADCSGFVQRVYRTHGVLLPRDSAAQAQTGRPASTSPENAAPGELLFFSDRSDGRVTHVGIAMGRGQMAHVSLMRGGFAVESFLGSPDDVTRTLTANFRGARRLFAPP
jgi:cell wall-associated NlpC family hydrolase